MIPNNRLIPIKDAAEQLGVSYSALRSEMYRGTLSVVRIGKNLYTTDEYLTEMIDKCRVQKNHHASSFAMDNGSSETVSDTSGLDALNHSLVSLMKPSPPTSRPRQRAQKANVVPIKRS